ncbi:MAG TPA: hypothetical protein VFT29_04225 [Gemmatimonadaceae bacterium]|nr:hypothetical protein [Gemmatimonadaceae bacterium]
MKRHYRVQWSFVLACLAGLLISCRDATAPGRLGRLEFLARISKTSVPVGESASLEFVIRNPTSETIRVNTSCGVIQTYIQEFFASEPLITWPQGCLTVAFFTDLAPGAEYVQRVLVIGGPPDPLVNMTPGTFFLDVGGYKAYAKMAQTKTNTLQFVVVQ